MELSYESPNIEFFEFHIDNVITASIRDVEEEDQDVGWTGFY